MFEEGCLLFFRPFLFKNGAEPQNKFFLVLKKLESDIILLFMVSILSGRTIQFAGTYGTDFY